MKKSTLLIVAAIALATLSTTSCKKYSKGVCEVKTVFSDGSYSYFCDPDYQGTCVDTLLDDYGYYRVRQYHSDKSCKKLGYTEQAGRGYNPTEGYGLTPGENGHFSSDQPGS